MSDTPYSDRHAMTVENAADTCDPQMLVVPHRKAMNLELELDAAKAKLKEAINLLDVARGIIGKHVTLGNYEMMWCDQYDHWIKPIWEDK